jgi:hypothetical protein
MRHLVDSHGREWHVYERHSTGDAPRPGRNSLVFDADGIVRRLWQYPSGWAELPDDALLGLMDDPSGVRQRSMG